VIRQHEANINTGAHFDSLYSGRRREEMMPLRAVKQLLKLVDGSKRLLDVGCGWGQYWPYVEADYTGIDFAPTAIQEARHRRPRSTWVCADFSEGLPFERWAFDYVLCCEVLEHVPDPALLVREMHRVLQPGGHLLIGVPYRNSIVTPEHLWEYEEGDWAALLRPFSSHALFRFSVGAPDMWEHFLVLATK